MTSQEALINGGSTPFMLLEEEDPPEAVAGETKTKNVPPTEEQRPVITYRGIDSDLTASVEMVACVHGWRKPDKEQAMSLMVFDYKLHYTKRDHHISSVKTEFIFEEETVPAGSQVGKARADPEVVAYAPFERELRWNETESDVKNQGHADVKLGVNSLVTFELSGGGEREISHRQKHFDQGMASRKFNNKSRKWDRVFWFLQQNGSQGHGVPSEFSVAILLKRSSNAKYKGTFGLRVEAGLWEDLGSGIRRFFRKAEDDPVNFNPQRKPEGSKWEDIRNNIDEENLGALAKGDELVKLVEVWGLDLGAFRPLQHS